MDWPVLQALWLFLPAYVANMSPVFSAKLMPWWGKPIDGGRMHKDGQRMLGDGKTWRGLFGGAIAAGLTAMAVAALAPHWGLVNGWDFGATPFYGEIGGGEPTCETDPCSFTASQSSWFAIFLFGAVVGFFALAGDAIESFAKRRSGRERGAPWIPFDQLDFVVFGLLGMLLASPLLADGWIMEALFGNWVILTTLIVGTPALHLLVNRIGYWLKLKEVPW